MYPQSAGVAIGGNGESAALLRVTGAPVAHFVNYKGATVGGKNTTVLTSSRLSSQASQPKVFSQFRV